MADGPDTPLPQRKPWLSALPDSFWLITGTYPGMAGTFTDRLATVLPLWETDGQRCFTFLHPSVARFVGPERITSARRLVLVHADDPDTAHFTHEQHFLDMTRQR